MDSTMMAFPLTLFHLMERARKIFPDVPVVSRHPDGTLARTSYGDVQVRALRLARALRRLGLQPGDRVATLAWNHHRHLEAYFGIPAAGGILHTVNPRLHRDDLTYILTDARDRFLVVDDVLWPVFAPLRHLVPVERVIVWHHAPVAGEAPVPGGAGTDDYEALLDAEAVADPDPWAGWPDDLPAEGTAAAMCYTSGTTGRPKGVVYAHRSLVLHAVTSGLPNALNLSFDSVVMPVVPLFHVNAWGLPYSSTLNGARLVLPGPRLDAASLVDLMVSERVTLSAGVPTVWLGVLDYLDRHPGQFDLSALRTLVIGGSAVPPAMIDGFERRHGIEVVQAWGMTEMSPLGTFARLTPELRAAPREAQLHRRAAQGLPLPLVEARAVGQDGPAPWDGETRGELQVRGPWVTRAYYRGDVSGDSPGDADGPDDEKFTPDGWFRTGDVVTIDAEGYVRIADRIKDLIKSGGEWIGSVALENALMGHPDVREAAVVAVPHLKWDERPVAVVVLRDGAQAGAAELHAHLAPTFARWWLPDAYVFTEDLPHTAAGKVRKTALRERLAAGLPADAIVVRQDRGDPAGGQLASPPPVRAGSAPE